MVGSSHVPSRMDEVMIGFWIVFAIMGLVLLRIIWLATAKENSICRESNGRLQCTLAKGHTGPCVDNRYGGPNGERYPEA